MAERDDLIRAALDWFKAGAVPVGAAALTDQQVIRADQPGPRPALPYATVKFTALDVQRGEDDEVPGVDGGGAPTVDVRGERSGTLSIQGFGEVTAEWLRLAGLRLRHDSIRQLLDAAGVTIDPVGGVTDISALVDTSNEPRFLREFAVIYGSTSGAEASPEATTTTTNYTQDGQPGSLAVTITEPPP